MTPEQTARAIVWLCIALPWLGLIPAATAFGSIVMSSIAIVAACHGYGVTLAHATAQSDRAPRVDAALAIQWGIAVVVALGGLATVLRVFTEPLQGAVVYAGVALHSVALFGERQTRTAALATALRRRATRFWLVPATAIGVLAVLHILGAAGNIGARPFDDETHHLGQLQRLRDTGALDDTIGFPRTSQLGGQLVLGSLTSIAGDGASLRWLDNGLGFVLGLVLLVSRLRPHDATTATWSLLMIVGLSAAAFVSADPSTTWLACGLLVALYETPLGRSWIAFAIIAGALATLRHELIPVALAAIWMRGLLDARERGDSPMRHIATLLLVALVVVLPYVVAWRLARADVPAAVQALVETSHITPARAIVGIVLFAIVAPLLSLLARPTGRIALGTTAGIAAFGTGARVAAFGTAAGIAGIVSQLAGTRPYATRLLWPIVLAFVVALAISYGRRPATHAAALVVALVVAVFVYEGRDAAGRVRWSRRYAELASGVEYMRTAPAVRARSTDYATLLARVPAGTSVAVWVSRPEELDHARNRIIDLRTPRIDRLRGHPWAPGANKLVRIVETLRPGYLLVESDHARVAVVEQGTLGWWCGLAPVACMTDIEIVESRAVEVARLNTIRLLAP